jgi:Fic family protein
MIRYNWEQKNWPQFTYSAKDIEDELYLFAEKVGKVTGILNALPEETKMETFIELMVAEAIKTSEIEGEYLARRDVMSSIKNNLGLNLRPEIIKDKQAEGIGELMIDVRNTFKDELTVEKLFAWHKLLFKQRTRVKVGAWRNHSEPMLIVSGPIGKEKIHFGAPPSSRIEKEMKQFLRWFNETAPGSDKEIKKAPVRSAIAHLYFESIHPFEDGNGRIGRAIAEKALAQGIGRPVLLSLSKTIESKRSNYYDELRKASQTLEISSWINYFVKLVLESQTDAEQQIDFTLRKTKFFDRFTKKLNDRQLKVLHRMFAEGFKGFQGGMNASKYCSLTKVSKATATRDLKELLDMGAFMFLGDKGGRSTSYQINF